VSPISAVTLTAVALAGPALVYVAWPLARRRADGSVPPDEERIALDAEKVDALRALRELMADREAGHLPDAGFAAELNRHEARAAAVLRRLDALPPSISGAARAAAGVPLAPVPWTRRPAVLGILAVGILVFGVALGVLVTRQTTPAPPMTSMTPTASTTEEARVPGGPPLADPPGDLASPGPGPGSGGPPRPLPPEMLRGMLRAARGSLEAGRYQEAIAAYQAILKRDPRNVDAITHLGLILAIAGHADGALEAFERALAIDGDYLEALWYKGSVLADAKRDDAGAIVAWERFSRVAQGGPNREQALTRIREARTRLASGGPAPPSSGTAPSPAPGTGAGGPAGPATPGPGRTKR
jgi:tetratricopeptide (TPR) repeat protein